MVSTADLISGFVALRSTRKVNNCCVSCDSSLAASAFSVITGDLMMSQTVLILASPPLVSGSLPAFVSGLPFPHGLHQPEARHRPALRHLCARRATAPT